MATPGERQWPRDNVCAAAFAASFGLTSWTKWGDEWKRRKQIDRETATSCASPAERPWPQ
ncbi:hypothetical protein [Streptomyces sp. NPDC007083]|uniref:hypothetical protein n=1 Tax=Streptomyces sp. NPDC007083 TaxID=3156913 RepID=UPI0033E000E0